MKARVLFRRQGEKVGQYFCNVRSSRFSARPGVDGELASNPCGLNVNSRRNQVHTVTVV